MDSVVTYEIGERAWIPLRKAKAAAEIGIRFSSLGSPPIYLSVQQKERCGPTSSTFLAHSGRRKQQTILFSLFFSAVLLTDYHLSFGENVAATRRECIRSFADWMATWKADTRAKKPLRCIARASVRLIEVVWLPVSLDRDSR